MINTLYANGCSWCQGYLLEEDIKVQEYALSQGYEFLSDFRIKHHGEFVVDAHQPIYDKFNWAGLLAERLGIPNLRNDAIGAGSNARIMRTTVDYIKTLSDKEKSELLVVIGWTLPDRGELWLDDKHGNQHWSLFNAAQSWDSLTPVNVFREDFHKRMGEYWQRHVVDVHTSYAAVKQFFQQSYLLANLLEQQGIRYYFFNTFSVFWGLDHNTDIGKFAKDAEIYQQYSVMPLEDTFTNVINTGDLKLSDGHPNSQGYKLWADRLYTDISGIYR